MNLTHAVRRSFWLLPLLMVPAAALGSQSDASSDGLARVVELARGGEFPRALALAEASADPIARAQAKLYVLHHAGDLSGALGTGLEGLRAAPQDLWLLERVCYISISLRAAELAREHVGRLAHALERSDLPAERRAQWQQLITDYRSQVDVLEERASERTRAALRARWTVGAVLTASLAALLALALRDARPSRRTS